MNIDTELAPAELEPAPRHPLTKEEAEQELALQHQFPLCKQQLYPQGAIQLPRNHQYRNNLTRPDPYTLADSIQQYDQQKIDAFYKKEHFTSSNDYPLLLLSLLLLFVLVTY
jgi:predicted alternative tryptophan synthase beta-subunit